MRRPSDTARRRLSTQAIGLGAVALVVFVLVELRTKDPLVDVRLLKIRGVWTAHVGALAIGFAMFGTFLLVPTLLQLPSAAGYGFSRTASEAGLFLLPTVVTMVLFGPLAGMLVRIIGPKIPTLLGGVLVAGAFVVPAIAHGELWQVVVSGLLAGAGIGLAFTSMSNAIVESVPALQTSEAISVNTIARTIGGSVGATVVAAIITTNSKPNGVPSDDAFTIGFWVCAGIAVIATFAAVAAPSRRVRQADALAHGVNDFPETMPRRD